MSQLPIRKPLHFASAAPQVRPPVAPQDDQRLQQVPYQTGAAGELPPTVLKRYQRPFLSAGGFDTHFRQNPLQATIALRGGKVPPKPTKQPEVVLTPMRARIKQPINATQDAQTTVAALFPTRSSAEMEKGIADTKQRLDAFPAMKSPGSDAVVSLSSKLDAVGLTSSQKDRVIECLAEYRLSLDGERAFDVGSSDVNWRHILGEMGYVIDALKARGITGEKAEDALLASMFSDCVKFKGTLLTHNMDGAAAAVRVLERRNDTDMSPARLAGIVAATKEHQIGPPSFMAKMTGIFLGIFSEQNPERRERLENIQRKMADPFNPEHVEVDAAGAARISFSPEEKAELQKIGITEWATPHPDNAWFDQSMAVITGDSIVNYATPEGVGKIVLISGPDMGTGLDDPTVFHSMFSCGVSFLDAERLLPPDFVKIAKRSAGQTAGYLNQTAQKLAAEIEYGGLTFRYTGTSGADALKDLAARHNLDLRRHSVSIDPDNKTITLGLPESSSAEDGTVYVDRALDYDREDANEFATGRLVRAWMGEQLRDWLEA